MLYHSIVCDRYGKIASILYLTFKFKRVFTLQVFVFVVVQRCFALRKLLRVLRLVAIVENFTALYSCFAKHLASVQCFY